MQRVADLLGLRAVCPGCGVLLESTGRRMREGLDECGDYYTLIEVTIWLEKVLGEPISDAELEGVRTLRDLASVVKRHLSADPDCEAHSIAMVQDAGANCYRTRRPSLRSTCVSWMQSIRTDGAGNRRPRNFHCE